MALLTVRFWSRTLGIQSDMNVILPQDAAAPHKVLYLLHGLSDNYSAWVRNTPIERYVAGKNVAVIMPSVNRGYYVNQKHGADYWDFISQELPEICRAFFKLSLKREDTFIAGLSMGGYGALRSAFLQPERFAAVAAFSPALFSQKMVETFTQKVDGEQPMNRLLIRDFDNSFGLHMDSEDDIFIMAANARPERLPRLYFSCGVKDDLYILNKAFHEQLLSEGIAHAWYDEENARHNWNFWDKEIVKALDWFELC